MGNLRTRYLPEKNYAAIFAGNETIRFEAGGPIKQLDYTETYDIALNNICYANCSFCYVSATKHGKNFTNVLGKIRNYFEPMTLDQRPFQVALGGHGEPTLHPEFIEVLRLFRELKIVPNYTTNGMHMTPIILEATKAYAGGVAVSTHPHLDWGKAVDKLSNYGDVHLHIIISGKKSISRFFDIYKRYNNKVSTFVLLPYKVIGRAKEKETSFVYLLNELEKRQYPNVAYGAHFHDLLKDRPNLGVSLYEPHMFSKYLILDDPVTEYKSSFDTVDYVPSGL